MSDNILELKSQGQHGFTMIEILIVLAVVAILAVIVIPLYHQTVIKESRTEAEAQMTKIAQNLESYKLVNNSYSGATLTNGSIYGSTQFVSSGTALYNFQLTANATSWTLMAQPINKQAGDGYLVLNDQGQRCWTPGSTSACTPSATTVWVN